MAHKLVSITHAEYVDIYIQYKDIVNPPRFPLDVVTFTNSAYMDWPKIGLEYYDTTPEGKKFKILDENKWGHYFMLAKIANG